MNKIRRAVRTLLYYFNHPLGRIDRIETFSRIIRWQIGSRVLGFDMAVPWVDGIRLLVRNGMHGATGNVYVGLIEFEDMAFVLHLLEEGDAFIDVGANVGVYSLLAASRGARSIALEPVPVTYQQLLDNIHLNRYKNRISARNVGVGNVAGEMKFSLEQGPTNHVLTAAEAEAESVSVAVDTLDAIANGWQPVMIKIDVEGFEREVIRGATGLLGQLSLLAVLIELNGLGVRYGFSDDDIHARLMQFGFNPVHYDPFARRLLALTNHNTNGNTLYVRSIDDLEQRLAEAKPFCWRGLKI